MPPIDAKTIFAVLGPLFLILGAARCLRAGSFPSQGRTWLLIGAVFCAVAAWLWWGVPHSA